MKRLFCAIVLCLLAGCQSTEDYKGPAIPYLTEIKTVRYAEIYNENQEIIENAKRYSHALKQTEEVRVLENNEKPVLKKNSEEPKTLPKSEISEPVFPANSEKSGYNDASQSTYVYSEPPQQEREGNLIYGDAYFQVGEGEVYFPSGELVTYTDDNGNTYMALETPSFDAVQNLADQMEGQTIQVGNYSATLTQCEDAVDAEGMAQLCTHYGNGKTVIVDHAYQGFNAIEWANEAYIGGQRYHLVSRYNGMFEVGILYLEDGKNAVTNCNDGDLIMVTCQGADGNYVTITYWQAG